MPFGIKQAWSADAALVRSLYKVSEPSNCYSFTQSSDLLQVATEAELRSIVPLANIVLRAGTVFDGIMSVKGFRTYAYYVRGQADTVIQSMKRLPSLRWAVCTACRSYRQVLQAMAPRSSRRR